MAGKEGERKGRRMAVSESAWAFIARFCRLLSAAGIGWSTVMLCFGEDIFQQRVAARRLQMWPSSCRTKEVLVRTTPATWQGESFVLNVG